MLFRGKCRDPPYGPIFFVFQARYANEGFILHIRNSALFFFLKKLAILATKSPKLGPIFFHLRADSSTLTPEGPNRTQETVSQPYYCLHM